MAHYSDDPDSKREGEEKTGEERIRKWGGIFLRRGEGGKKGLFRPIPTSGAEKEEERGGGEEMED